MPPWEKYQSNDGPWAKYGEQASNTLATAGESAYGMAESVKSEILGEMSGVDYGKGADNALFRAGFSAMDTNEEKSNFLNQFVGESNWKADPKGRYIVTKEGLSKLGVDARRARPIDEKGVTWYDVADWAGDAPSILGAVGAGMASTGAGASVGIPAVMLGAGAGKALGEAVETQLGYQKQPLPEQAKDVGAEMAYAGIGETGYRGLLAPIGKKLAAPYAKRTTPERVKLMKEAVDMGAIPSPSQITGAPIMGRFETMIDTVFQGSPKAVESAKALNREMGRLRHMAGPGRGIKEVGAQVKADISSSRKAFSNWAKEVYGKVDELSGGQPIVPTTRIKSVATEIYESFPKGVKSGEPGFISADTKRLLAEIADLPDSVTTSQMQAIRGKFWDSVSDNTLTPGLSSRHARNLAKSASKSFDDALEGSPEAIGLLKAANKKYSKEIKKFEDAFVKKIMLDPKYAGIVEPEDIVDAMFKRGKSSKLERLMKLTSKDTQEKVRRAAMEDVLRKATAVGDDPLESIFQGKVFRNTLDDYGSDALHAMFGTKLTNELYRFSHVMQVTTKKLKGAGGLVAAGIAVRPLQNLGTLAWMRVFSKFAMSKGGLKYLTEGMQIPKTRKGMALLSRAATQMSALADDETTMEK